MYMSGRVNNVVYEDAAKGFYILRMVPDPVEGSSKAEEMVTVTGQVVGLSVKVGSWFGFEANWVTHKTYGRQLQIVRAPVLRGGLRPDDAQRMLSSNGVGDSIVSMIRVFFGDEAFIAALGNVEELTKVPGLTKFSAMHVASRWTVVQAHFRTLAFLSELEIPKEVVRQVWTTFGDDAERILSLDPWALVQIEGISFSQADEVAIRLGLSVNDPARVRGAVLWACRNQRGMGHLHTSTSALWDAVSALAPGLEPKGFAAVLGALHKDGQVVVDRTTKPGQAAVYEPSAYTMEKDSADWLSSRSKTARYVASTDISDEYVRALSSFGPATAKAAKGTKKKKPRLEDVAKAAVDEWGTQSSITLSEDQKRGVLNALVEPISILTGLPGAGKTTSLRAVVDILRDADVQILLLAPTGIAAKNLAVRTRAKAYTIHRAFSAKGSSEDGREATYAGVVGELGVATVGSTEDEWGFSQEKVHPAMVAIIDEASMVDQHLLYRILSCTAPSCRLVFVGDAAQLPSVGPGNVLRDLISSGCFPTVALKDIFRQADASAIVFAAHAIHKGEIPVSGKTLDFTLLEVEGDDQVAETILRLAQRMYDKRDNFQILSPRHAGLVGVTALNAQLRALLNPQEPGLQEIRLGSDTIREGDRIMVIKNNYQLEIYNGDVGKVERILRAAKEVEIKLHGSPIRLVKIPFADVPRYLRLAYVCTIHKAQGLEYDKIVMPLVTSFRHQLQRNLLYTAITRAKKKVVLVGSAQALAMAIGNDREDQRNTLLPDRLKALLGNSGSSEADTPAPKNGESNDER